MSRSDQPVQFGPNEWLVEEMYEQFLADPSAVDSSWHDFFADYRPASQGNINGKAPRTSKAPPATPTPAARAPANGATARAQIAVPARAQQDPQHDTTTPLRGAAARVVANMEASLELPTATSVRAVPAKLLADNRIVINNHLQRTRGGKISFTHLIGYAVVRALAEYPQMNRHFTDRRAGKPSVVAPEHVNLGLAIDLPAKRRAALVVASIKRCEVMTFAQFWQAYEDIVRKARAGTLTAEDFAGTTITLTNPGTHRHQPLGAAADVRAGRDHRRRRDGVPGGVPGRQRGDARRDRRSARSSR